MEATAISNEILPAGSPFLALFCLVPFYLAIYHSKSYRESFWLLFIQSCTVHLISSYWLANFKDFAIFTLGASAAGTAVMAGLSGVLMYLFPSHETTASRLEEAGGRRPYRSFLRMLWFASAWTFWEWIKSTGFLAYPWGTLSMAAYSWKILTQVSSITGIWGVTFIYALFNALIGEGIFLLQIRSSAQRFKDSAATYRTEAAFTAVVFSVVAVYGLYEYFMPRVPQKSLNTVIVQQNIDPWEGGERTSIAISKRLTEEKIKQLEEQGKKADLVLWSEGVLNHAYPGSKHYYSQASNTDESLSQFIKRMDVPFVIGAEAVLNQARRHYGNAAVFYDRSGEYAGFYCKMHLVPFAEVIPYADNPLMQKFLKTVVGFSSGWTPGKQFVLFQIPIQSMPQYPSPLEYRSNTYTLLPLNSEGISDPAITQTYITNYSTNPDTTVCFTTPICFEDAFPDVCSRLYRMGSEVFMNITNDSWSATNSAEYQHFIAASYLAIEYRTTLVRCANAGYSVVVDPSGRIIADLPLFTQAALATPVPVYKREATLYALYGDWFAYLCIAFMAIFAIYYLWQLWFKKEDDAPRFITITIGRRPPEKDACTPLSDSSKVDDTVFETMQSPAKRQLSPVKKQQARTGAKRNIQAEKAHTTAKKPATSTKKSTASTKKQALSAKKSTTSTKKHSKAAAKRTTKPRK